MTLQMAMFIALVRLRYWQMINRMFSRGPLCYFSIPNLMSFSIKEVQNG